MFFFVLKMVSIESKHVKSLLKLFYTALKVFILLLLAIKSSIRLIQINKKT